MTSEFTREIGLMEEDEPVHREPQLGPEMVVKEPAWGGGRRLPVLWHSPLS